MAGMDRKTIPARPAAANVRVIGTVDISFLANDINLDLSEIVRRNSDQLLSIAEIASGILEKEQKAKIDMRAYKIGDPSKVSSSPIKQYSDATMTRIMDKVFNELTTGSVLGDKVSILDPRRFLTRSGTIVDIQKDLNADDLKYRRIPSQDAWVRASDIDQISFPTTTIEVAVVISNNVRGDQLGEQKQGTHEVADAVTQETSGIMNTKEVDIA
jgi:hypothetical protein